MNDDTVQGCEFGGRVHNMGIGVTKRPTPRLQIATRIAGIQHTGACDGEIYQGRITKLDCGRELSFEEI